MKLSPWLWGIPPTAAVFLLAGWGAYAWNYSAVEYYDGDANVAVVMPADLSLAEVRYFQFGGGDPTPATFLERYPAAMLTEARALSPGMYELSIPVAREVTGRYFPRVHVTNPGPNCVLVWMRDTNGLEYAQSVAVKDAAGKWVTEVPVTREAYHPDREGN